MNTSKTGNKPAAPQSQLAGKPVSGKAVTPESTFGQFVLGDIKGGDAAHHFRMNMVRAAIREALKGNSRALLEAKTIAEGKSKKAKAYQDGFQAVGIPARIAYTGKLSDSVNAAVVEKIEQTTLALAEDFMLAFCTRINAPAEPKEDTKGKKTKGADADATGASSDDAAAAGELTGKGATNLADMLHATITAINSGMVSDAEMDEIIAAITYRRLMAKQAAEQATEQAEPAIA
jgi:hypothetical protein